MGFPDSGYPSCQLCSLVGRPSQQGTDDLSSQRMKTQSVPLYVTWKIEIEFCFTFIMSRIESAHFAFKIAETLQGVQGFGGRSHPSPRMALQYTFLCCKLDVVVCLPSLCIKQALVLELELVLVTKNLYLLTVLFLSHTQVRINCVPFASFDLTLLHIFCKRHVQVMKLHRPYH